MERKKVIWLAAGVLMAGICGALPFRRPLQPGSEPQRTSRETLQVYQSMPPDTTVLAAAPDVGDAVDIVPSKVDQPALSAPAVVSLAESFMLSGELAPDEATTPQLAVAQPEAAPTASTQQFVRRPLVWRRHRIKDGDSLATLAQAYLGDPARGGEIFAFNRDILASPDLLPVGAWLRIPEE